MRTLRFAASGQRLDARRRSLPIAAGSKGYLRAAFDLSPDFDGMAVAAEFADEEGRVTAVMLDEARECAVPDAVTDGRSWSVRLAAAGGHRRFGTNYAVVTQEAV